MNCPNCATENPPLVKFCGECGTPLGIPGRPVDTAERRHLTVLFADLAGSTALAEALDPEDLRELYTQYQTICSTAIGRYEGHVAQFLGDGVLAYFGYPAAHEDDAPRAVRAALDILELAAGITTGGRRPHVRIGIHTGLVVIGDVGAGTRREQLAQGEAPNIAARLQSEALPDSIVISDATRLMISGQFAHEDLGSRTLKGLSRPMRIFRVLGKSGAASRFQAMTSVHGLTPFVGRGPETDRIRSAWDEIAKGRGRTVLLRGEAGIGKSRLLQAAQQTASGTLHELFQAECSPYQMNSPLNPVIEMIERRTGITKDMQPGDKLDLLERFAAGRGVSSSEAAAALAELLSVPAGDRYPVPDMPPAKRRQWLIGILAELLVRPAEGLPVLLLFEDLHWADPSTLDLLGEILALQPDHPVLVVATTRPELSTAWLDHPACNEIRVQPLPPDDTRALVASVVGAKPLPLSLLEELVTRTGGIPLFVEAVTRSVIEAGILRELEDRYELTGPIPAGLIPTTVQDSLMGRIDRLGADRSVAQLAATIGRESSFELLQTVLGRPADALTRALKRLVDLELVSESGTPPLSTYTFKHALIQDAAYESLLRRTRQEFHGKIAEALIHRFPGMAETKPELLARHFEGAGRTTEAIAGWIKAGLHAQQHSALRESAAYLQKAIHLLQGLPSGDPGRLQSEMEAQLALSPALMATLGWGSPEVETACKRSRELCQQLGNMPGLVGSLWGLWTVYFLRGTLGPSLEAAQAVLDMALAANDPGLQIAARQAFGYSRFFRGDFAQARDHADKALVFYDPERERALVAAYQLPLSFACAAFRMMSLWFLGFPEQADRELESAWALVDPIGIPYCNAFALGNAILIHYGRRDAFKVAEVSRRLCSVSEEGGFLLWLAQGRIYRGWAEAMNGSPEAGIAEIKAAMDSYKLTGSGLMTPQFSLMLAEAQLQGGGATDALASISRGLKHCDEFDEHMHEPDLHRLKAEILLLQGAETEAESSLLRGLEVARHQEAKMLEIRSALALSKLWHARGRAADVRELLRPLYEWFEEGRDTPEVQEAGAILQSLQDCAKS